MINGGALTDPYLQNETHTTAGCAVWGAQLRWYDYAMQSPCAMNSGLSLTMPTPDIQISDICPRRVELLIYECSDFGRPVHIE